MNSQMTLFKQDTIKEKTREALKKNWLSTTQLIFMVGASSADRRRRTLEEEGVNILERKRPDSQIIEYHIE